MDPAFITPFIASIQNVFSTMLQLRVDIMDPQIKQTPAASYDVSGIIGMSGDITGSIVLSFPAETAARVVSIFAGAQLDPNSADFADAVGELVNMVSGNAKGKFPGNRRVNISTPSVVVGKNHTVGRPKDVPCIVIPCRCDCGEMAIEIAIRQTEAAEAGAAVGAAAAR
jgi:chemotaxis protein CheX